jgi:outer membrane protein assembly factor BamA
VRALVLSLLLLLAACVPARRKVEGNIVRSVHFEGNDDRPFSGQTDYELGAALETRATGFGLTTWPFVYTVDPRAYRPDFVARDAWRLEVWYAHRGWFDARTTGWDVRFARPQTDRRAGVVDLVAHVDPGPRSSVRSVAVEGVPPTLLPVVNAALRRSLAQEGDPFDLAALEETRAALLRNLQNQARPYASVDLSVSAHPDERAVDVVWRVDPGIVGKVGPVRIAGEKAVLEDWIADAARLETGSPLRREDLQDAQRRLFDLGTFSVVTVEPDLSDPTRSDVPVRVKVTETRFRRLRLGVGFDYDSYVPIARTSARLRDNNLFGALWKAELGAKVGLAVDVAEADFYSRLPTWGVDLALRDPRLFRQRATFEVTGSVTQDIYNGLWSYQRPEADVALVVRATDHVQFRVGPHAERYAFLGEFGPRVQAAQQRLFGIESEEAFVYELTSLDQHAQWDWRDDPVRTTRGSWYSLQLREALPLTPNGYGFFRASGEARRFVPVRLADRTSAFPLTLAGRAAATVVAPFRPGTPIPLPERAFLGGPSSVRGFRANQVGPYTTLCTYEAATRRDGFLGLVGAPEDYERVTRYHLPEGGSVAAQASAELRYDWVYGVLLSGFVDAGALATDLSTVGPDDLRVSVGVGARYDTVVGPLRFDVAARPLYPEDLGPARYAQCRTVDAVPRTVDFVDNFVDDRASRFPLAIVFYLTFGEAI